MEWRPLVLSFEVAAFATVLATIAGVAVASFLAVRRFVGRELLDVLFTAPMVLPPTVLGYYVLVVLGRSSVIGRLFERATGSAIVFTTLGAVIAAAIGAFPLVVKSARAAIEAVDPLLVDAARTLGAGPLRALWTVQLPLAARGISAGIMLGFARALGDFGVTLMVAGDIPGETQTAALAIYDAIEGQREPAALGMIAALTALAIGLMYAGQKLGARGPSHG
jgi:molybdate transport system permease protein